MKLEISEKEIEKILSEAKKKGKELIVVGSDIGNNMKENDGLIYLKIYLKEKKIFFTTDTNDFCGESSDIMMERLFRNFFITDYQIFLHDYSNNISLSEFKSRDKGFVININDESMLVKVVYFILNNFYEIKELEYKW